MVSRFGTGEMETILRSLAIADPQSVFIKSVGLLLGRNGPFWWDNSIRSGIHWIAGVYPPTDDMMAKFALRVLEDCKEIDLLGGWVTGEKMLHDRYFPHAGCYPFEKLVQPDSPDSWTHRLAGKRVLVISPFDQTILRQYAKRLRIWHTHEDFLPDFELKTYHPVVSHAGNFENYPYRDWLEALDKMKEDIKAIDFDIALVSAGAYGMNLAAEVKRMGRTAIHMGGVLQLLFGIKGRAFDGNPYFSQFYNDEWTRPSMEERPKNYKTVEGGSYW